MAPFQHFCNILGAVFLGPWYGFAAALLTGLLRMLTGRTIQAVVGPEELMLRPPYGFVDETLKQWAKTPIVCWSVDTEDWKDQNVERIVQTVTQQAEDGDIILMHDIFETSVTAALACVDRLMAQGYYFVTVEELFALRGEVPQEGGVYLSLPPKT